MEALNNAGFMAVPENKLEDIGPPDYIQTSEEIDQACIGDFYFVFLLPDTTIFTTVCIDPNKVQS